MVGAEGGRGKREERGEKERGRVERGGERGGLGVGVGSFRGKVAGRSD